MRENVLTNNFIDNWMHPLPHICRTQLVKDLLGSNAGLYQAIYHQLYLVCSSDVIPIQWLVLSVCLQSLFVCITPLYRRPLFSTSFICVLLFWIRWNETNPVQTVPIPVLYIVIHTCLHQTDYPSDLRSWSVSVCAGSWREHRLNSAPDSF